MMPPDDIPNNAAARRRLITYHERTECLDSGQQRSLEFVSRSPLFFSPFPFGFSGLVGRRLFVSPLFVCLCLLVLFICRRRAPLGFWGVGGIEELSRWPDLLFFFFNNTTAPTGGGPGGRGG